MGGGSELSGMATRSWAACRRRPGIQRGGQTQSPGHLTTVVRHVVKSLEPIRRLDPGSREDAYLNYGIFQKREGGGEWGKRERTRRACVGVLYQTRWWSEGAGFVFVVDHLLSCHVGERWPRPVGWCEFSGVWFGNSVFGDPVLGGSVPSSQEKP